MSSKSVTLSASVATHKQVQMLRLAASGLNLRLSLPEANVKENHEAEAKGIVKEWIDGGWSPKKGSPADVEEAIANRLATADALMAEGIGRSDVSAAIGYYKRTRNRADMSPEQRAEGFLRKLGLPGEFSPPEEEKLLSFGGPPEPQAAPASQLGFGPQFGSPGPVAVADAPRPGAPSASVIELAAKMAAQGLSASQITEALAGLKAAGML